MRLITIILILTTIDALGQDYIKKSDLKGEWFVANNDSSFFTNDTLVLIKRTNKEIRDDIKDDNKRYIEPEIELLGETEYVNLRFNNRKEFHFWESNHGGYLNSMWTVPMKWKLERDTITITSDKFVWNFLVLTKDEEGKVEFEVLMSNYPEDRYKTFTTNSIKLKRIKN